VTYYCFPLFYLISFCFFLTSCPSSTINSPSQDPHLPARFPRLNFSSYGYSTSVNPPPPPNRSAFWPQSVPPGNLFCFDSLRFFFPFYFLSFLCMVPPSLSNRSAKMAMQSCDFCLVPRSFLFSGFPLSSPFGRAPRLSRDLCPPPPDHPLCLDAFTHPLFLSTCFPFPGGT